MAGGQTDILSVSLMPVQNLQLVLGPFCQIACPFSQAGYSDRAGQYMSVYCHTATISSFHLFGNSRWILSHEPAQNIARLPKFCYNNFNEIYSGKTKICRRR